MYALRTYFYIITLYAVFTLKTETRLTKFGQVLHLWQFSCPLVKWGREACLTGNSLNITRRFTRRYIRESCQTGRKTVGIHHRHLAQFMHS